jgi:hypothetical protein
MDPSDYVFPKALKIIETALIQLNHLGRVSYPNCTNNMWSSKRIFQNVLEILMEFNMLGYTRHLHITTYNY